MNEGRYNENTPIGTWAITEPLYPLTDSYQLLECMTGVLQYLSCPLMQHEGYIFWKREKLNLNHFKTLLEAQYWSNSILISSTTARIDVLNENEISAFDGLVESLKNAVESKISNHQLGHHHEVTITKDEEYGDVILSLVHRDWHSR